jgi:signal transduction histidine kinase
MTITPTKSRVAAHLAGGGFLAVRAGATLFLIFLLWAAAVWSLVEGPTGAPILAWIYALTVPVGPVVMLWAIYRFAERQRERIRRLGVELSTPARQHRGGLWRLIDPWRTGSTWRQVAFHLYAVAVDVPGSILIVAPRAAGRVAELDVTVGRVLLGPDRAERLAERVAVLSQSRAEIIAATDAERRRIERDLHDGVQQRLVSMAMNLGMARAALPPSPEREAIDAAHDEAVAALGELREFVRGLHPAVLNDRGLDAALSGIAARAPLPVRVEVDADPRCPASIEAIAYFTVAEALTNVAKHAAAEHAAVTVRRTGDVLRIEVTDDGTGGATVTSGSGLGGLAQRAAAADGKLTLDSPPGGPTTLVVELPCG